MEVLKEIREWDGCVRLCDQQESHLSTFYKWDEEEQDRFLDSVAFRLSDKVRSKGRESLHGRDPGTV